MMRGEAEAYTSRALSRTQKFLRRKRVVSLETDTEGVCFACEQPKAGL